MHLFRGGGIRLKRRRNYAKLVSTKNVAYSIRFSPFKQPHSHGKV